MSKKKTVKPASPTRQRLAVPSPTPTGVEPAGYAKFLEDLKIRIRAAQIKAGFAVNREMILLYWGIGRDILERQEREGWGAKVIDRLAADLRRSFPEMRGVSARNLKYMRAFGEAYRDEQFVQQVAAQIPWFHHCVLLEKVKAPTEREWYIRMTIDQGWSRNVLALQIDSGAYRRHGQATTNFSRTLPAPQSDLARQMLKDPYNFDFLTLEQDARELDLQRGLLDHLRDFLIELGVGFAFVGSRYHLEVGGRDFYIDLLFYHLRLRCFVAIELKVAEFEPEHSGKMNFYLSAVDDLLRHPGDNPTIGLILCPKKNGVVVEYSLRNLTQPMGVAGYEVRQGLPEALRESLPAVETLEAELRHLRDQAFHDDSAPAE